MCPKGFLCVPTSFYFSLYVDTLHACGLRITNKATSKMSKDDDKKSEAWRESQAAVQTAREVYEAVTNFAGYVVDKTVDTVATAVCYSEYRAGQDYVDTYRTAVQEGASAADASRIASAIHDPK